MKTILVVFGGRSAEHDVSIVTAHIPIIEALQAAGLYDIYPLYIAKDGSWYCQKEFLPLAFFQKSGWEQELGKFKKVDIRIDNGLNLVWPGGLRSQSQHIDMVFPSMHGTYGEDGSLMGLLRLANVPFVGCDLAASVVAMDKVLTKQVAVAAGVPSVPYIWFSEKMYADDKKLFLTQISKLKYPLFVKPVHLGSSIAITRVEKVADLENAIEVALHYDDKVIVEQGVQDLVEVTLPIMGNDDPRPALLEEPVAKFFTYEEKYLKGGGKKGGGGVNSTYSKIPAEVAPKVAEIAVNMALDTYRILGCTGMARIDLLIDEKTSQVFMNEVNTLPGSLYHHNWRKAGVSAVDLVNELVRLGEEHHAKQSSKTFFFDSDILRQVGGAKSQS